MSTIKLPAASGGGSISLKGPSSLDTDRDLVDTSGNINLLDSQKLNVGTGNDLKIRHDGTNNHIEGLNGSTYIGAVEYVNIRSTDSNGSNAKWMIRCHNDAEVSLYHNNTLQCETSANGLAFPSGKGIDFSATSDANGKSNELLDNYEEGTWNPAYDETSVTSTTYTNTGGHYTRVGNLVTFTARVQMTGSTSTTGNPIFLEGLPFVSSGSHRSGGANFSYQDNWLSSSSSGTMSQVAMYIADGESKIGFYDGDGNHIDANNTYANAQKTIAVYGFYYT